MVRQITAQWCHCILIRIAYIGEILNATRMGQEMCKCNGLRVGIFNLKSRKVSVDVCIQIKQTTLNHLHH